MDTDAEALELAQDHLKQLTQQHILSPDCSVTCYFEAGNTLLSPVFGHKTFDIILANPPYITETRGQKELFRQLKDTSYYSPKMDLCDAFVLWALAHLTESGTAGFVLPAYWTQRNSASPMREKLWQQAHILELWQFDQTCLFERAPGHHSSLLIFEKRTDKSFLPTVNTDRSAINYDCRIGLPDKSEPAHTQPDASQLSQGQVCWNPVTRKIWFGSSQEAHAVATLQKNAWHLSSDEIQQGLVMPQGRLSKKDSLLSEYPVKGIFLLTEEEVHLLNPTQQEQSWLRPYYEPRQFRAGSGFTAQAPNYWLIYGDQAFKKAIFDQPEQFPNLKRHLDYFASGNTSAHAPYGLHRARQVDWFESADKILSLRQCEKPAFAPVSHPAYVNENFNILRLNRERAASTGIDGTLFTQILNSKLAWFWFYHHNRKGTRLQIDKTDLLHFPLPHIHQKRIAITQPGEIYTLYRLQPEVTEVIDSAYARAFKNCST